MDIENTRVIAALYNANTNIVELQNEALNNEQFDNALVDQYEIEKQENNELIKMLS